MAAFQTDYQTLVTAAEDSEVTPDDDGIFHVPPGKTSWHHIENPDEFFKLIYQYHQQYGYACIAVGTICVLVQFPAIISFFVYTGNCIKYEDVGKVSFSNGTIENPSITDLLIPPYECMQKFNPATWTFIIIASLFGLFICVRSICRLIRFNDIRNFYNTALKIPSSELQHTPWHDVQCRLREVQREQLMCIHKQDLSELDIYHRILRHVNYLVALANKNIIPVKYNMMNSEIVYFPPLFQYILTLLLFRSYCSPFKNTWQLKEDYKKFSNRHILAAKLSGGFLLAAVLCALASIFIFLFILMFLLLNYGGFLHKEPSFFSTRKWSPYAMLYLRHFNELDHEFTSRLNRAHGPATQYMNSFYSPVTCIIIKTVSGLTACITIFFCVWTILQPLVIEYPYVVTISVCFATFSGACLRAIPKDNEVFVPDLLLTKVIAHINYKPDRWIGRASCPSVRKEFSQLFQLRITSIFEELLSPFIVPFILFKLRSRSLDIVDFFRSFTVEVAGVGDVCSFALMDISRHGNHEWVGEAATKADHYQQAENGKTELSLLHFAVTNPQWQSPPVSSAFISRVKEQAQRHARDIQEAQNNDNALVTSLHSMQHLEPEHSSYVGSLTTDLMRQRICRPPLSQSLTPRGIAPVIKGNLSRAEGPLYSNQNGIFASLLSSQVGDDMHLPQDFLNPLNYRAAEISFNALYLHELHERRLQELRQPRSINQVQAQHMHSSQDAGDNAGNEQQPLLDPRPSSIV